MKAKVTVAGGGRTVSQEGYNPPLFLMDNTRACLPADENEPLKIITHKE